jgi:hypothetical protein
LSRSSEVVEIFGLTTRPSHRQYQTGITPSALLENHLSAAPADQLGLRKDPQEPMSVTAVKAKDRYRIAAISTFHHLQDIRLGNAATEFVRKCPIQLVIAALKKLRER